MIDTLDKATLPLIKSPRGRPKTGKALSPAEKQKRYRERLKQNESQSLEALQKRIKQLEKENRQLKRQLKKYE